jgi:regulator of protease activity HflC (stomatin/prohibitin superfamily)
MFGFKFVKFQPGQYVLKYKNGKIKREGEGISFYYFSPTTSLVAVPVGSNDVPFIFTETTSDFQEVSIQGQITYRISNPKQTAQLLNFTLDNKTLHYISDDPDKLPQRLINSVQVITQNEVKKSTLKESLSTSQKLVQIIVQNLGNDKMVQALGVEILSVSILAVKPNPETSKALEAETREEILKESDNAIFHRRNSAVEQERIIKENELNTEIAIENKNREIKEKQIESEKVVKEKQREILESEMIFNIEQEKKRSEFVTLESENERKKSEAKGYAISTIMKAYEGVDPVILQSLASVGMDSDKLIALAFQGIADKADKIGQLNISPELLQQLLKQK